ncbi:MAG: helix-turn-helix transcriptional regulator [Candidatus Gottesmanbacteria bacterium]|nr:helix-turn-helix transcriptional regulator [Candidatus Gottesmanbacteria bacterium]
MKKRKIRYYTFEDDLKKSLKDPGFRKAWKDSEAEYLVSRGIIEKRLAKKLSQRDLALRVKTSQAAISRVEAMNGNPSLGFLKRIATALGTNLRISFS